MSNKARKRIACRIAYDGTAYSGWQRQTQVPTIQGELENALLKFFKNPVSVTASGRTDAGVHADYQIVHLDLPVIGLPCGKLPHAINPLLPADIRILSTYSVGKFFHARYDALKREYIYKIRYNSFPHPIKSRYAYDIPYIPDVALLNAYATVLLGIHDFTSFTSAGDKSRSKIRNVLTAVFYAHREYIYFKITANGFLWKMIRNIVGTFLEGELQKKSVFWIMDILKSKDRRSAGITAPPHGLVLTNVIYKKADMVV